MFRTLLPALALALFCGTAGAQAIISHGQSFVDARLLPGKMDAGQRIAGLRIDVKKGWKTYWRDPGGVGIPPSFDWSASENVASVEVLWPRPEVFQSFGERTIGYGGRVLLPIVVTPVDPARDIRLAVTADLGVCRDICVLETFSLAETIAPELSIGARQIARAHADVPGANGAAGLRLATCLINGRGAVRQLSLVLEFERGLDAPTVLIDSTRAYWVGKIATRQPAADRIEVDAELHVEDGSWVTRKDLRATVLATGFAADIRGCRSPQ